MTTGGRQFRISYLGNGSAGQPGNDVTLTYINHAPLADSQVLSVTEDGELVFALTGSDPETPAADLIFTITSLPNHGSVLRNGIAVTVGQTFTGSPLGLVYLPGIGCEGVTDVSLSFTVTDTDAAPLTSAPATVTINITAAVSPGGLSLDAAGIVRIGGTAGNDTIILTQNGGLLYKNGVSTGILIAGVTEIRVWGRAGNDLIDVSGLGLNSYVDGGAGDDTLVGGSARDLIFGGVGNDQLTGGAGNDFLIGGAGSDRIVGSAGHDILAAGDIDCQATRDDLEDLLAMWADHVIDDGDEEDTEAVFTDEDFDQLTGSSGSDWFIVNVGDKITDLKRNNTDGDVVTYV